jgi:predicted O-linked N-acetylglucosamine transferase (SPINDLY family)
VTFHPGQWLRSIASRIATRGRGQATPGAEQQPDPGLHARAQALLREGRGDDAEPLLRQLSSQYPNDANLLLQLGGIEARRGRFEQAIALIEQALRLAPDKGEAQGALGNCLKASGRHGEALTAYARALALRPDDADAWSNQGEVLLELGRLDDALQSLDRALALQPAHASALSNRAEALVHQGFALRSMTRYPDALAMFDAALRADGTCVSAWVCRGVVLRDLHRLPEALDCFGRALALNPACIDALINRGVVFEDCQRLEDALATYDEALRLQPRHAPAHYNRGLTLNKLRRREEALASYNAAIAADPAYAPALLNRADLLLQFKQGEAAAADFERLAAVDPQHPYVWGHLARARMSSCDWTALTHVKAQITEDIRQGRRAIDPFHAVGLLSEPALLKRCSQTLIEHQFPPRAPVTPSATARADVKIRIGYAAGEFREHATSYLMAELFERHDRGRFELIAFDNGWDDGSAIRQRLDRAFTPIIDISRMTDDEAAAEIARRRVDILVDLNGHVGLKRTGVFSRRPAPIQVNWLGFPGTTGAPYMDYLIGDPLVTPPEHDAYYTEKVVRLPDTYQPNDARRAVGDDVPSRSDAGLPETGFVYCCFNDHYKITPDVFDVWMRLLARTPGSVLWLLEGDAAAARNLRIEAATRGITPEQLVFAPRMKLASHLARHALADLFVDTLPYNAHTTASDALWAGLPLVTCLGHSFAGRVAASLLHAIGLPELVTRNLDEYEALALKLATMPALLADVRTRLRRNRDTHPLFDCARFTQHLESAYLRMHERYLNGEAPISFDVAMQ